MNSAFNQNDRYRRKFVNWQDRPSNSPAARFAAQETVERVRELNEWFDQHQAAAVLSEAEALCAAEGRRRAAAAAAQAEGWERGEPGE